MKYGRLKNGSIIDTRCISIIILGMNDQDENSYK